MRGVCARGREPQTVGSRPIDGAETHGARLARSVDLTSGQLKASKSPASSANRDDLGVRRGVIDRRHLVCSLRDDLSGSRHDCAERSAPALPHIFDRKGYGAGQQLLRRQTRTTHSPAGPQNSMP